MKAQTVDWVTGDTFQLQAPILNFTIQDVLDPDFRIRVAEVLKLWIDQDVENLVRIKNGIHRFWVPGTYETNTTKVRTRIGGGVRFRKESFPLAQSRLIELLGAIATHYYDKKDMVNAAICAMALRQLDQDDSGIFESHNTFLHMKLNKLFGMEPPSYVFQACDSLLTMVKAELARHGIADPPLPSSEAE